MPHADVEARRKYHREYMRRYYAERPEYRASCKKRQQSPRYKDAVRRYRKTEVGRCNANAALRRFFKTDKGREARRRYIMGNPDKCAARRAVRVAKRCGKLVPTPYAVCGEVKVEAHHNNYSKPLDVVWLCKKHHEERDLTVKGQAVEEEA